MTIAYIEFLALQRNFYVLIACSGCGLVNYLVLGWVLGWNKLHRSAPAASGDKICSPAYNGLQQKEATGMLCHPCSTRNVVGMHGHNPYYDEKNIYDVPGTVRSSA